MYIVPLIGAEVPLDELFQCAARCDTTIDIPGGMSISKKKHHPQPRVLLPSKKRIGSKGKNEFFGKLVSRGLVILNEYHHNRHVEIDGDNLADLLLAEYPAMLEATNPHMRMLSDYDAHMDGVKKSDLSRWTVAETQCRNAALSALDKWDETYIPTVRARAREQGAKGGRGYCTYTLDDHLATAHLQAKDAAAALGINVRTVHRMRRRYADLETDTGEVHAEAPHTQPAEPVDDGESLGDRAERPAHELGDDDAHSSSRSGPHASDAQELHDLILPF